MSQRISTENKRKNLPVSLNKKIYDLLEEVSIEKDTNKSKLVEKLIRDYLKNEKGIDTTKII
jgi:metal-responsive CopG/Arc/MetJ family transcriptional regulator